MIDRLQQMEQRYEELSAQLSLPEVVNDREKYQKAGKALSDLETPVMKFREMKQVRVSAAFGDRIGKWAKNECRRRAPLEQGRDGLMEIHTALSILARKGTL